MPNNIELGSGSVKGALQTLTHASYGIISSNEEIV